MRTTTLSTRLPMTDIVVLSPHIQHSVALADSDFQANVAATILSKPANQPHTVHTAVQAAKATGVSLPGHFLDGYAAINVLFSEQPMVPWCRVASGKMSNHSEQQSQHDVQAR